MENPLVNTSGNWLVLGFLVREIDMEGTTPFKGRLKAIVIILSEECQAISVVALVKVFRCKVG